jgi:hypothetical protein
MAARIRLGRRMKRPALVLALVVLVVPALSACSRHRELPAREGLPVEIRGLSYTVFITRELNVRDPEDRDYFRGPDPPPGFAYFGVFMEVCNDHKNAPLRTPVNNFKIVDTEGNQYSPMQLPADNIFAYRPEPLGSKRCVPELGSTAASAPTGGSLLLFKLPVAAIENRPLDLEIGPPPNGSSPETERIELDI